MSVVRLVTKILPHSYDRTPSPPPVQGTTIFSESCGVWPELTAETTVFHCQESADNDSWEGLTELRKSRLRLSACEDPPPPLVRVRPAPGGVLLSVPLRIARTDLNPKSLAKKSKSGFGKKFRCRVCGKGYKTKKPFETHCREHESSLVPKNYVCDLCGQGFHNAALFSAHRELHNQQAGQTLQCNPQPALS